MSTLELQISDTVQVSELRHRLALGLAWIDSTSQIATFGTLATILEKIGAHPVNQPFEVHRADRFALRYAGIIQKRLDKAIKDGTSTDWQIHVHGGRSSAALTYDPATDPRLYVPRRLRFSLVFKDGVPAPSPVNMRTPWLWPGAAYPFPATSTIIRGRVLRGAALATAKPVRWARLFVTTPESETVFNNATIVGCGHGDDRGEFVMALDSRAVSGAALKNPVQLRLWAYIPPAGPVHPEDPLDGLPLEIGGTAVLNNILRGIAIPTTYTLQKSSSISLQLGETKNDASTTFLFPP